MKCIYCLEDQDPQYFLKTEHVMSQSFGLFKNNFSLNGIVCDRCNKYFGDNLEIKLARDTLEGISRYTFGVKEPEEFKSAGKRSRIAIEIAEGEFKGAYAYLEYSEEQDKIVLKPVPQIGFRKKDSSEYEFFLLDHVPERIILEQRGFDLDHLHGLMMLDQDRSRLEEVLSARGITNIKFGGEIQPVEPNQDWLCKVEREIDNTIRRAVAKIAFNYLAFWEGREFVLHEDFDVVRRFIRNDETPPYPLVLIDDESILQDERGNKRRVGHLITLEYAADGKTILSQVSILNFFTYKVCLAREFSGLLKDIRKGHFFNIKNMEIWELGELMQSHFLNYSGALKLNRDVFLLNYRQELNAFDDTYGRLFHMASLLSKRDDQGKSIVGLAPLIMIMSRQSTNAFECLTQYQIYNSWLVFRPALEALLFIGKFLDDFENANLWKNKREIYNNKEITQEDKKRYKTYRKEFEGKGLIPKSLCHGESFRQLLTRINDQFVHTNYDYLEENLELTPTDNDTILATMAFTGEEPQKHKAHLYSFLHMYRLMVVSLGKGLASRYRNEGILNVDIESIEQIWKPKVEELIQDRPDLKDICNVFGLWEL